MRSLGSSDGGVLPAGSPDCWEGIAYGPASAHLRTPRLQSQFTIIAFHAIARCMSETAATVGFRFVL